MREFWLELQDRPIILSICVRQAILQSIEVGEKTRPGRTRQMFGLRRARTQRNRLLDELYSCVAILDEQPLGALLNERLDQQVFGQFTWPMTTPSQA
jgi:hypothetical protein